MLLDKCVREKVVVANFEVIGSSPTKRVLHRNLRIKENLDSISKLVFDAEVGLHMKKVDQGVCEWCLFLVDSLEHITSHHDWIVIQQSH